MAELTPEVRQRLEALRERIEAGDMSEEELRQAGELIRQVQNAETGGIPMATTMERAPTSVEEITAGFVNRPAFEMAGGTVGAVVGGGVSSPSGPGAIAGALAGGGLGAAGGSASFDALNGVLRKLGVLATPPDASQGMDQFLEIMGQAGQAGISDVAFAGGAQAGLALAGQLGKPLIGRVLGLRSQEAQDLITLAQRQGIDVSASTAATGTAGRVTRGAVNIFGLFPWLSSPVRRGLQTQFEQVEQRVSNLLDNFAPNATLTSQLGLDMVEAARGARGEFRTVAGELYDHVRALSAAAGDPKIIPTDDIRRVAAELVEQRRAGTALTRDGAPITPPADDPIQNFLTQLATIEDAISIPQFRQLSDDLAETVNTLRPQGFDVRRVAQLREAMELSLNSLDATAVQGGEVIVEALEAANRFYAEGIVKFQTPTAQRFGRVDRRIFGPGADLPGTMNADQTADFVLNLRSPQAVRDLRSLVGDDVMNGAARNFLEGAVESSRFADSGFLDFQALQRQLGLTGPRRIDRAALEEFIGPDTLRNIEAIGEVAENLTKIPAVNQFVARRAVLGGASSAVRALTGTALAGASAGGIMSGVGVETIATLYFSRRFANLLTNPEQMQNLTRVITDTDMPLLQKRALLGRTMEIFGDQVLIEPTGSLDIENMMQGLTDQEWFNRMEEFIGDERVKFNIQFVGPEDTAEQPRAAAGGAR